ncbi:MAG TPA: DUF5996 family protein [Rhizomicrobium sp.]
MGDELPELPLSAWKETCATLQLWMQIVGKTRLAVTPWLNHSWHVTFEVTARGLSTPLMHAGALGLQIEFDFIDHSLRLRASSGETRALTLRPMTVAAFYTDFLRLLAELRIDVRIDGMPNEIADAIAFRADVTHGDYDPRFANRFWRILVKSHAVFSHFRTSFLGKASPVHFFWGSFDLAGTRFSGRRAPLHPGGVPHLPDAVVREAYSHEVSSAGFWPGGPGFDDPAFYSYAWPAPSGYSKAVVRPAEAFFSAELGEFVLPYDVVRTAVDPDALLMEFLQSTYAAAAELGKWDRETLECSLGRLGVPRPVE